MDPNVLVIACIGALMLVAGAWGFSQDSRKMTADAFEYYSAGWSLRVFFTGVLALAIFVSASVSNRLPDQLDHVISYSFLTLGIIGFLLGLVTLISPKTERFLGRLIRRTDSGHRAYLLIAFFGLGAAFLFAFFLFYPPFLSIG